jgi:hypothetical protein
MSIAFLILWLMDFRYIRLIDTEFCLVAVEHGDYLDIYLDHTRVMANAISTKRPKRFNMGKIGRESLFAVDEAKRLFAMLANHEVRKPLSQ